MNQQAFSDIEYSGRTWITKREELLDTMNEIIPWEERAGLVQPFYYQGKRGRPPKGIEKCCGCTCCRVGSTYRMKV